MSSFSHSLQNPAPGRSSRARPSFSSQKTSDRLREGRGRPLITTTILNPMRRSIFREIGLDEVDKNESLSSSETSLPAYTQCSNSEQVVQSEKPAESKRSASMEEKSRTFDDILGDLNIKDTPKETSKKALNPWLAKLTRPTRPMVRASASAPPGSFPTFHRLALIVFLIAVAAPALFHGRSSTTAGTADAGAIPNAKRVDNGIVLAGREDTSTDVCTRWSHQTAVVNGTLYIYGGRATSSSGQTSDTWNNDFLSMDLTETWQIESPSLTGLSQPSGPPAVANGYLWHDSNSLFLYGGEFSDTPATSPSPVATWQYNINSLTWTEYSSPQTSAGNNSDGGSQPVQRAAEGAGLSIPELGKSYYFGGHQDLYTTEGWSNQIARVYLKSLLEFTHPGYTNTGVDSLGTTAGAPSGGVYRNITEGGIQDSAGFTERADGALVYVPGWGDDGIMLGLAGGTAETYTEMNIIDIYDIATSTWYKQSTSGTSPPIRVNPCAVVAAAPDGSSFNVYLYGGQNLIPYGDQIQYSDMWILTIPSFTWIEVDMDGQSQPPARAGHTCNLWDSQMVIVGGYVGTNISCDSPGIYVFNASSLEWINNFTPLASSTSTSGSSSSSSSGASGSSSSSGSSGSSSDTDSESDILQGSVGYEVPAAVQSVIGGSSGGGATASTPAAGSATAGPLATGKPPTFTVTKSGGTVTQTGKSTATGTSTTSTSVPTNGKSKMNIGAIAAGTVAGILAILAAYLAFCTWLYRKQLRLYKNHVAMAQRTAFANSPENHGRHWNSSIDSTRPPGQPMNEKVGAPIIGAFGTELRPSGSGSAGRPSYSSGPTPGTYLPSNLLAGAGVGGSGNESGGETSSGHRSEHTGGYAGTGMMPGGPAAYGRLSEEAGEDDNAHRATAKSWEQPSSGSTAHSSVDDLLGGQEPSFFSVVWNPRRTLKVVNLD